MAYRGCIARHQHVGATLAFSGSRRNIVNKLAQCESHACRRRMPRAAVAHQAARINDKHIFNERSLRLPWRTRVARSRGRHRRYRHRLRTGLYDAMAGAEISARPEDNVDVERGVLGAGGHVNKSSAENVVA